jgi:DnaJ family protein C protein 16
MTLFFLIFLLSLIFVKSEYEVTKLPGHKFNTEDEIKAFLNKTDVAVLVFYYKKESDKSNEVAKSLKIVYSKLRYLIDYILIDCDKSHMDECRQTEEEDIEDAFYRIEMYVPPQYKYNPYTKELNPHQKLQYAKTDVSDKALYKFLTKIIISREQKVTNENYETFKSRADLNKVILFTNKKTTPLMFRGLSGYFYDRLHFGVVQDTEKKLCKRLNITNFPSIMIIQTIEDGVIVDEPIDIMYKGELDVEHIVNFLNKYALKEKLYLSRKQDEVESEKNLIYFFKLSADKAMDFFKKKWIKM